MAVLSGFCATASYPRDPTGDLHQEVPLETTTNRSVPMACGPNVDQAASFAWFPSGRARPLAFRSLWAGIRSADRGNKGRSLPGQWDDAEFDPVVG